MQKSTVACLLLSCASSLLVNAPSASADQPLWKVGLASVKITPREPVRMSGYASRTQPSQGIALDLYAKAMAIEDREGNRAVLVTSDVIGFRASFAEPTCRRISEATGLRREQILLNSSHTHTGPTLSLDENRLDFPADQAQATVKYTRWLQDRLIELVAETRGLYAGGVGFFSAAAQDVLVEAVGQLARQAGRRQGTE